MKSKNLYCIAIILIAFSPLSIFAQINGKLNYKVILESEDFKELNGTLLFNDVESFFYVDMQIKKSTENHEEIELVDDRNINFHFDFSVKRPIEFEVYINREKDSILSQSSILKDLKNKPCVVLEETGLIKWEFLDETKKIGLFTAHKAMTSFRGREYIAWFTPEIPVGIGPWKFHGLPGIILEIQDKELGVQFLFSSIQIPFDVKDKIKQPNDGDILTLKEYVSYRESFKDDFIKSIRAKLPRDVSIASISVKEVDRSIEREYK